MANENDILGPSGGIPVFRDGALFSNITANGNAQVKGASGVFQRVTTNTAGTTSSIAVYDGLSAAVTITIASPGVVTWDKHGLVAGDAVEFTTNSALPSGLVAGTIYYVTDDSNLTINQFAVSDTKAHALAGTNQVNTTGSQSGTQTGWDVNTPIGQYSTTSQGDVDVGAYFAQGLIAIAAGGAAANVTVLYN